MASRQAPLDTDPAPRRPRRLLWLGAGAVSILAHLAIVTLVLIRLTAQPVAFEPEPLVVSLVRLPPPVVRLPSKPAKLTPTRVRLPEPPRPSSPIKTAPLRVGAPRPVAKAVAAEQGPGVSDADLAGAVSADAGPSGRPCDMPRLLQSALRRDPLAQVAVAHAGPSAGRVIWVWNGDWVQTGGEDGKGLSAVREAIMWEIAFAPAACRAEPVRGLIVLSLNAAPDAPRLAVGANAWRWSDLLRSSNDPTER